jgi:hypothetical protein
MASMASKWLMKISIMAANVNNVMLINVNGEKSIIIMNQ